MTLCQAAFQRLTIRFIAAFIFVRSATTIYLVVCYYATSGSLRRCLISSPS